MTKGIVRLAKTRSTLNTIHRRLFKINLADNDARNTLLSLAIQLETLAAHLKDIAGDLDKGVKDA